jgi:hypothetical protein
MRRAGLFVCVVTAAAVAAGVALAAQSPRAVRASIIAAARAKNSVHYKTSQINGNASLTLTGDVAADEGTQQIKLKIGKKTGQLAVVVSNQVAYEEGDALGLGAIAGLTKTQATTYAGQWISIPKGDKDYAAAAADVTLGSVIQGMTPHGRLAVVFRKLHGMRVIAVVAVSGKGKKKELQVLAARRGKNRLPVEEDETAPGLEYIAQTLFSHWNESVQAQAPSSSVPISTVRGS